MVKTGIVKISGTSGIILSLIFLFVCTTGSTNAMYRQLPHLKRILINDDSALVVSDNGGFNRIIDQKLLVKRKRNRIGFEFAGTDSMMLRYRLDGFDDSWSEWTSIPQKEFTNLMAGRYKFNFEFSGSLKGTVKSEPVVFRVMPWWFLSPVAISVWVILFILVCWFIVQQMKYRFARTQFMLEQIINTRTEELIREKEKTENLLTNVLPKNTANEIMTKGKAEKIKYNFVTVLFSDIQGFTKIAEEMNPEILIDELDKFFFHFDSVVEKYGIEKIKTIGDAYMCAGGIPERNRTNPVEVILAALEMQKYMEKLKSQSEIEGLMYWDIRIGIHTGTVVAGVVGQKKLSYDIWGDTVNTASRMESSGEAGKINISGTTYEFVKEFYLCEHRGKMPVKYKGELDMYFVRGIVDELRDEDGFPNQKFILKMQLLKLLDIEEYIIKMFDEEAPPNLYFHSSQHTKSICTQVDLLANSEVLSEEDYIHLRLASVFIFTGYITDYEKPDVASCGLVDEILPKYGFKPEGIEKTKKLIINLFSDIQETDSDNILHDAVYDYLGRIDFPKLTEKLLREETEFGKVSDSRGWLKKQTRLLEKHEFITPTARLLRGVAVEQQIIALHDLAREVD